MNNPELFFSPGRQSFQGRSPSSSEFSLGLWRVKAGTLHQPFPGCNCLFKFTHGRKKPPVPVDPESAEMPKDETASTDTEKRITKEEKRQAKIRNIEKKRLRREERKYGKTRRIQRWHMDKEEFCIILWQQASYCTVDRYSTHKGICAYHSITARFTG